MAKRIVITFEDDLTVRVEAEGFKGNGCLLATRPYEQDFGGVVRRTEKAEMAAARERVVER